MTSWISSLFTDPEVIFGEIREIYEDEMGYSDQRPSTLYISAGGIVIDWDGSLLHTRDGAVVEADDESERGNGQESGIDEDNEMADVGGEIEGHQEAAEEYVRFHLRS